MTVELIAFVALALAGSLVAAVFGFGSALIVLTAGPYLIPVTDAIALSAVLFGASTLTKTLLYWRQIDWKIVAVMAVASVPFAYLGAELVSVINPEVLRRMLAVMILLYLTLDTFDLIPRFKIGMAGLIGGSAAYGFASGLMGTGSLIKVVMFREMNISKQAFVGAMAASSVLASFSKIVSYSRANLLHADMMPVILALVVMAVAAALIGRRFLLHLSTRGFEIGLRIILAIMAAGLLF